MVRNIYGTFITSGTKSTTENSTFSFRLNGSTDTEISAAVEFDELIEDIANNGLSITVAQGDYFELKLVTPMWTTNPTNVFGSFTVLFEPA